MFFGHSVRHHVARIRCEARQGPKPDEELHRWREPCSQQPKQRQQPGEEQEPLPSHLIEGEKDSAEDGAQEKARLTNDSHNASIAKEMEFIDDGVSLYQGVAYGITPSVVLCANFALNYQK